MYNPLLYEYLYATFRDIVLKSMMNFRLMTLFSSVGNVSKLFHLINFGRARNEYTISKKSDLNSNLSTVSKM